MQLSDSLEETHSYIPGHIRLFCNFSDLHRVQEKRKERIVALSYILRCQLNLL